MLKFIAVTPVIKKIDIPKVDIVPDSSSHHQFTPYRNFLQFYHKKDVESRG